MPKARSLSTADGSHGGWMIFCPACGCGHLFDQRWTFNGDAERPTFTPSMLVHANPEAVPPRPRCHSYVTAGEIRYLDDSTHELRGKTVPLEDF